MVVNTKSPKIPLSVPASSTKERVSDFMQTLQDDICQERLHDYHRLGARGSFQSIRKSVGVDG